MSRLRDTGIPIVHSGRCAKAAPMTVQTILCKNVKCYLIHASEGYLLFDAAWPDQYPLFKDSVKAAGIRLKEIRAVVVSHFHIDHAGLAGMISAKGIRFVVFENQVRAIDAMERLIERKGYPYTPIEKARIDILRLSDSRAWLSSLGIRGQIIQTRSHGDQGIALLLDSGEAFIGDLPVIPEYSELAQSDWDRLRALSARFIYPAHAEKYELAG